MGTRKVALESEIRGLKQLLASTDYKALKHADGALTDEEYEPTRLERQELRDKINTLEWELEGIKATDMAYQAV